MRGGRKKGRWEGVGVCSSGEGVIYAAYVWVGARAAEKARARLSINPAILYSSSWNPIRRRAEVRPSDPSHPPYLDPHTAFISRPSSLSPSTHLSLPLRSRAHPPLLRSHLSSLPFLHMFVHVAPPLPLHPLPSVLGFSGGLCNLFSCCNRPFPPRTSVSLRVHTHLPRQSTLLGSIPYGYQYCTRILFYSRVSTFDAISLSPDADARPPVSCRASSSMSTRMGMRRSNEAASRPDAAC
ncbi:hypothetical protein OF83DRAFT_779568 [Amylostereum chailletii]|nr:hypothetical protein OF83DRAFT_779568 [Amylostereum chailletii]